MKHPQMIGQRLVLLSVLLCFAVLAGCQREMVIPPTPVEVLEQITALGGKYRTDTEGRVWFVSFHRCPLQDGDLEILYSLPGVRILNLRGISVVKGTLSSEGLKPIESLKGLRRLDLSCNKFQGTLELITAIPTLEFLNIQSTYFDDAAVASLSQISTLKTLVVDHRLSGHNLKELCNSPVEELIFNFPRSEDIRLLGNLKKLRRWDHGFPYVPVDALPAFAGMDRLENFRMECTAEKCSPEAIAALRSMKSLRTLSISGSQELNWEILAALDGLPQLQNLTLAGINDAALAQIPQLNAVEILDLRYSMNGMTAGSAEGLTPVSIWPQLRHLKLNPVTTTASGLEALSRSPQLSTLEFTALQTENPQHHAAKIPKEKAGFGAADLRPVLQRAPLTSLIVGGLGFGDELLQEVVIARNLEILDISKSHITDDAFQQLDQLPCLKSVEIYGTRVSSLAADILHKKKHQQIFISDNWCCGCLALHPIDTPTP